MFANLGFAERPVATDPPISIKRPSKRNHYPGGLFLYEVSISRQPIVVSHLGLVNMNGQQRLAFLEIGKATPSACKICSQYI